MTWQAKTVPLALKWRKYETHTTLQGIYKQH